MVSAKIVSALRVNIVPNLFFLLHITSIKNLKKGPWPLNLLIRNEIMLIANKTAVSKKNTYQQEVVRKQY